MSANVSISGLLGVAFIVLKIMGYIAWPWVLVLAPFWIPLVFVAAVFVGVAIITLTVAARS